PAAPGSARSAAASAASDADSGSSTISITSPLSRVLAPLEPELLGRGNTLGTSAAGAGLALAASTSAAGAGLALAASTSAAGAGLALAASMGAAGAGLAVAVSARAALTARAGSAAACADEGAPRWAPRASFEHSAEQYATTLPASTPTNRERSGSTDLLHAGQLVVMEVPVSRLRRAR